MPLDPTLIHQEQIENEKELRNQFKEGSPLWRRHNENIRYHEAEIRQIQRMKKMGMKF